MDGKYMYDFIKNTNPNTLGSLIIDYVEKLKADNKAMKQKLTLTDVVGTLCDNKVEVLKVKPNGVWYDGCKDEENA